MGATFEEHLQNLATVFDHLLQARLWLKPTKCHLVWKEITYLGFVVSDHGVVADPQKVRRSCLCLPRDY